MTDTAIEQMAEALLEARTKDEFARVFEHSKLPEADKRTAFGLAQQRLQAREDALKQQHAERLRLFDERSRLFDGLPEGTTYGEAVRIKAKRGDPLAQKILAANPQKRK